MGRTAKDNEQMMREMENGPQVVELNEGNVKRIFDECMATENSKKIVYACLFPSTHGYKEEDELIIPFDEIKLLEKKQSIEYMYGQLKEIHSSMPKVRVTIDDYVMTYSDQCWTNDKTALLQFLLLGVNSVTNLISPFRADSNTSVIRREPPIKPTLSPKALNFSTWFERYKAEWENAEK